MNLMKQLLVKFEQLKDVHLLDITFYLIWVSVVKPAVDENSILLVRPSGASEPLKRVEFEPLESVGIIYF